jgi:hypothetical protein
LSFFTTCGRYFPLVASVSSVALLCVCVTNLFSGWGTLRSRSLHSETVELGLLGTFSSQDNNTRFFFWHCSESCNIVPGSCVVTGTSIATLLMAAVSLVLDIRLCFLCYLLASTRSRALGRDLLEYYRVSGVLVVCVWAALLACSMV